MTETSTEHEASEDTPTLDSLAEKVDKLADTVAGLASKIHGKASEHEASKLDRPTRTVEGTREHAASLQEEIQAELARLKQQEAADKKQQDLEARVTKAEKAAEKQPREYKRRHYVMGWVTDDDR